MIRRIAGKRPRAGLGAERAELFDFARRQRHAQTFAGQ